MKFPTLLVLVILGLFFITQAQAKKAEIVEEVEQDDFEEDVSEAEEDEEEDEDVTQHDIVEADGRGKLSKKYNKQLLKAQTLGYKRRTVATKRTKYYPPQYYPKAKRTRKQPPGYYPGYPYPGYPYPYPYAFPEEEEVEADAEEVPAPKVDSKFTEIKAESSEENTAGDLVVKIKKPAIFSDLRGINAVGGDLRPYQEVFKNGRQDAFRPFVVPQ
jgi:hypothetical protein